MKPGMFLFPEVDTHGCVTPVGRVAADTVSIGLPPAIEEKISRAASADSVESPIGYGAIAFSAKCSPTFWMPHAVAGVHPGVICCTQPGVIDPDCSAAEYLKM